METIIWVVAGILIAAKLAAIIFKRVVRITDPKKAKEAAIRDACDELRRTLAKLDQ